MMKKTLLLATVFMVSCLFCAGSVWGILPVVEHCVTNQTELQAALTTAESNGDYDLIKVVQGTYTGNFTYSSGEGYGITLEGGYVPGTSCTERVLDPANTILDGGGSGMVLKFYSATAPYITVDGFTIQHGGSTGLSANMSNTNSTGDIDSGDIEISNNIITSNTSTAGGGALLRTSSTNGSSGNVTVVNNVISGNTTTSTAFISGIEAYSSSDAGGTVTLTNNTITGNINPAGSSLGGAYMNAGGSSGVVNCYNNIIRGNTPVDIFVGGTTKNGYNNNYTTILGGWDYGVGTNIDADPLFVDVSNPDSANWDLHLRSNSPCIDAGHMTPPGGLPTYDFEGDPRNVDGDGDMTAAVDIGADEYVILNFVILHRDGALWSSATGWVLTTPPYYAGSDYARDLELLEGGDYLILHKDGALYDSAGGWTMTTPPYYAGSNYAVDMEVTATDGDCILHRDGALWSSDTGWTLTTPPYYAGSDYARALELSDDTSYVILHKHGAIYDSASGWVLTTPPYYAGSEWVVDLKLDSEGSIILHKDGAVWSTGGGWVLTTPPYYAGTDYARALEMVRSRYIILHKHGSLYDAYAGWILTTPPYYPGSVWAVDLEMQ